ncbi:DedA family protein [Chroococcidiopsis sp. CCNUC1]|jgi:membrane protein DedA with SNARE-associated domain|uniref:DedA family protein n=1 Tax=Chroococcidiopsis sp. CCNUC1 TaxID=2653189 RepID=UPI000D06E08D|nr:DedA family protein [Chroococcidiopsis sp. CCNUC1]PSB41837.1 alkaline phosphatase [Cyanosarcina cf. burmensis CCALA 770]URD49061.1 DedA family protein [Chroococcidiopsis sp. CCNUC1]
MLDWITNVISRMGYLGITLLMVLENFFPPVPEEIVMPLAGFTVQRGELNFLFVVLAGTTGTVLGAIIWYHVGKLVGEKRLRKWVDKHGKWIGLSGEDIDKSKRWFAKYGGIVVFFGRFIPGIRTYISIPAGLEGMALLPFVLYSSAGTFLWIGILTYAGYVLGQNYQLVEKFLSPASTVFFVLGFVCFGIWVMYRRHKQKQKAKR